LLTPQKPPIDVAYILALLLKGQHPSTTFPLILSWRQNLYKSNAHAPQEAPFVATMATKNMHS